MRLKLLIPTLLIALALAWPVPARPGSKLVAAVLTSDISRYKEAYRAFVRAMAAKGYDQGSVEFILQSPNPDPISWANSVRKFNAIRPDVLVTFGAPATLAAMKEVNDIPVVFTDVYAPVEAGVSRSMTRTGSNLCGVSSKVPLATLMKAMVEIRPVRSLGVLFNSRETGSFVQLKEMRRLAAQQGFAVVEANVATAERLDAALSHLLGRVDCLFVAESSVVGKHLEKIVRKSTEANVPVISLIPDAAEKGALVALEVSPQEQGQLAADYAAKILSGRRPGEMPIATPHKVELIVNLQAAKTLEFHIPFRVLSLATKVLK